MTFVTISNKNYWNDKFYTKIQVEMFWFWF